MRGDPISNLVLRINVIDHARRARFLRIRRDNHYALRAIFERNPLIGLTKIATHVAQQVWRLDAILFKRLVRHAKKSSKRIPQRGQFHLKLIGQYRFQIKILAPRRALRLLQLLGGDDRIGHQRFVFSANLKACALTLAKRNR